MVMAAPYDDRSSVLPRYVFTHWCCAKKAHLEHITSLTTKAVPYFTAQHSMLSVVLVYCMSQGCCTYRFCASSSLPEGDVFIVST